MKIKLLHDCRDRMPKGARLMGMDLGAKTIGLAISDSAQSLATPIGTIKRTKFNADILALKTYIDEFEVGGFILGWPLNMDGSRGARCDTTLSFADELARHSEILSVFNGKAPFIALWDERLSTSAVDEMLDNRVDMKKKSKRGAKDSGLVDSLAAQIILQGALDSL